MINKNDLINNKLPKTVYKEEFDKIKEITLMIDDSFIRFNYIYKIIIEIDKSYDKKREWDFFDLHFDIFISKSNYDNYKKGFYVKRKKYSISINTIFMKYFNTINFSFTKNKEYFNYFFSWNVLDEKIDVEFKKE